MLDYHDRAPVEILLIEDSPGDVRLTQEALKEGKVLANLRVARDGEEALAMLRRQPPHELLQMPDLILLDLNLPKMDGRDVLREIKADENLKLIPVVVLTTSAAEKDIAQAYALHANCYITKPVDLEQFIGVVRAIDEFWLTLVKLPRKERA